MSESERRIKKKSFCIAYSILWQPEAKNWLIGKEPGAGKDQRQEKGTTEDEMVWWHHWLDGHEFEQALGVGDGQGSLARCSPRGRKESDTTERLNWWLTDSELVSPIKDKFISFTIWSLSIIIRDRWLGGSGQNAEFMTESIYLVIFCIHSVYFLATSKY